MGNLVKFIGSNLIIFCYKEFQKFARCKSVSQSKATFIVYFEPIKSEHVKITILFYYKEFEKFARCKSVSQSKATFIVCFEPIKSEHGKNFS